MRTTNKSREKIQRLTLLALLSALVAVLAYFGGFIKIGIASISLTLIPVVIGAALCGPAAGAWLGLVSGIAFLPSTDGLYWMGLNAPGTIITVLVKGTLAGLCAGLVYLLLEKRNRYVAVVAGAIVCPIVNTAVFLIGCMLFFLDTVSADAAKHNVSVFACLIIVYVGFNFIFELLTNIILSPAILRILNIRKKNT